MGWQYMTYVSPVGRRTVQLEIDRLNMEAEERLKAELRWLYECPIHEWHMPHAKKLQGRKYPCYEIRFTANKRAMRPIGFFGPGPNQYTIVMWAFKKQDVYDPTDALDSADRRIKEILDGRATVVPLTIDGENIPSDEE